MVLGRMVRFWHTLFVLPFALMGAFLAGDGVEPGFCGWGKLGLILWCMASARTTAMLFNRIVDAEIDGRNPRTANRELPSGVVAKRTALWCLGFSSAAFCAGAMLFWKPFGPWFGYGNYWPVFFALPVLLLICGYSFAKRFTWASHFWLGVSLMAGPVGAWVAVSPPGGPLFSWQICMLGGAVGLWGAGFDIIYAIQDVAVDRRDGLYSLPAAWGVQRALWVSRFCHVGAVVLWWFLGRQLGLGWWYNGAVLVTAGLLLLEHWLVRRGEMRHIWWAFGIINGVVSLLLAAGLTVEILVL